MSSTYLDTGEAREVARGHKDLLTKLTVMGVDMSEMDMDEIADGIMDSEHGYVYIQKSNRLFKLSNHKSQEPEDYLLSGHQDSHGTIFFLLMYYDGGTCFEEMFSDLYDKIESEQDEDK